MNESILLDYLKGISSEEDCLRVEQWCDESPDNRKLLEQLYYINFIDERLNVLNRVDTEAHLERAKAKLFNSSTTSKTQKVPKRSWRRWAVPVAAFLTGIVFMGFLFWGWDNVRSGDYIVSTLPGQRAQVVLPDGSKVWLNSSTQLTYHSSFLKRKRLVDLSGEAYFEVTSDKHAPFVVNAKNIKTNVLGTKFNVRAREDERVVVTTLLKGRVRVDSPLHLDDGIVLNPGQTLTVNADSYQTKLVEYPHPDDVLLWINGRLCFQESSLLDITNTLERLYDVRFIYEDDSIKTECFTCEFSTETKPETVLSVISQTHRVAYKKEGSVIRLSRVR